MADGSWAHTHTEDGQTWVHPAGEECGKGAEKSDPLLTFFAYAHLPQSLQEKSRPFYDLAKQIIDSTPRNTMRDLALLKLLEAKDCAVRAAL